MLAQFLHVHSTPHAIYEVQALWNYIRGKVMLMRIDDRSPELKILYEQLQQLRELHAKAEKPLIDAIVHAENCRQPKYIMSENEWDKMKPANCLYVRED